MRHHIAIIGAGISGLSCATALQNAGFKVTVFEKSRGVSGRMSTRVSDNWQCDHGAQYFTARDPQFYAEVQRWVKAGVTELWQPKLQVYDGQNFTQKQATTARFVGVPRNTAPANFLAESLNVVTGFTVNQLQHLSHHSLPNLWQLSSVEQGLNDTLFNSVVLAIPAPQAAALLQQPDPELAKIAESLKMRGCWALMCQFKKRLNLPFDGLFVNDSLLSWVARDSAKPGRASKANGETWILHADSAWSEVNIEADQHIIAEQMIAEFIHLGGEHPVSYSVHRWRYAECVDYLNLGYVWSCDTNIGLCGDWLNGGKVQGAWLSGKLLADKLTTSLLNAT